MDQQEFFRRKLTGISAFAEEKNRVLTEEEIRQYFEGITLTGEQWDMVYAYLQTLNIHIAGRKASASYILMPENYGSSGDGKPASRETGEDAEDPEDDILAMYLEELDRIAPASPGEEAMLFDHILDGDSGAVNRLTELYLYTVIAIAREYAKGSIPAGDLIQEGNIGLLTGISMLQEKPADVSNADYLVGSIREAMEVYILDQSDETNISNKAVEKANKLQDAIKGLEEDLGTSVSKAELSAYLDMPSDEIDDILRIIGDNNMDLK